MLRALSHTMAVLCTAALPATALGKPALPRMSAAELANNFRDGTRIEVRLDADINGDGLTDVTAVGTTDDKRTIRVMLGYVGETDIGYRPVGEGELDLSPLTAATLTVSRNVLVVTDLTGGTTATQSRYRYRYDAAADRMRLIGDDVTHYSRTNQHGSIEVSTNRLTGKRIVIHSPLAPPTGQMALIPGKPKLSTVSRAPIYMENAPAPDDTIEMSR